MKLADFVCEKCGKAYEDQLFMDTEQIPEYLKDKCDKCGGKIKKDLNFKRNCQVWRWNDHGGM